MRSSSSSSSAACCRSDGRFTAGAEGGEIEVDAGAPSHLLFHAWTASLIHAEANGISQGEGGMGGWGGGGDR